MTQVAQVMLWIFVMAWCAGVAAWFYVAWSFVPLWASHFHATVTSDAIHARRKKAVRRGIIAFFCAIAVAFAAGGIAHLAGGWGGTP